MPRFTALKDIRDRILYEDNSVVVVNKPAGIAVQSASTDEPDVESLLKNYYKGGYVGVVHRLDQPVEGLVVFARTAACAGELGRQVQDGRMQKRYFAAVYRAASSPGISAEAAAKQIDHFETGREYVLTDYLLRNGRENRSYVVDSQTPGAKRAVLSLQAVQAETDRAVLWICLQTGRHHQIRVQLSQAGWPLSGDLKYGAVRNQGGRSGLGLCAAGLSFIHPSDRRRMQFQIRPEGSAFEWADQDIMRLFAEAVSLGTGV